jgi:hypothetical protein
MQYDFGYKMHVSQIHKEDDTIIKKVKYFMIKFTYSFEVWKMVLSISIFFFFLVHFEG